MTLQRPQRANCQDLDPNTETCPSQESLRVECPSDPFSPGWENEWQEESHPESPDPHLQELPFSGPGLQAGAAGPTRHLSPGHGVGTGQREPVFQKVNSRNSWQQIRRLRVHVAHGS